MELEYAIPEWLRKDRTVPSRMPPGFTPPFEVYTSRFPETIKDLAMAIIGVQYASADLNDGGGLKTISSFISSNRVKQTSRPAFHEVAAVTDNRGFYNVAMFIYWPGTEAYKAWSAESGFDAWWSELETGGEEKTGYGWFLEVFLPTADRFETVVTTAVPEGAAHMRESSSGAIKEHAYWGSMRDRLPISQTDQLLGDADADDQTHKTGLTTNGGPAKRFRVPGKKNLTVIRSGQDWSAALPEERQIYLDSMQPPLIKGMEFLRDHGDEVGCFSCRFMDIVDPVTGKLGAGGGTERTFALAYFDNLASLEGWSKSHKTHLAIFGQFAKYAKRLGDKMSLRLFHEVLVLEVEQQFFEYIGCHEGTGMLRSL
ncbi:hypothetical protein Daus18300_012045 [Diaporthe australafricana]|uniref:Phenylacetaldoxime dehydratase n=1 Tax=Diaporthe australafricana TaxID=127596 RepID=A0ABR3W492_9PEZI